ncbi:MAG: hypothetical protein JSS36_10740 [Proteobacteria bacterium]|nr:hypothetical protein [Pseudomonadota bacterium]
MSVEDDIGATGRVIQAAAAVIALMPSLALLSGAVPMPPSFSDLIKVVTFFLTLGTILLVFMVRNQIRTMSTRLVAILSVGSMLIGCVAAISFYFFSSQHLIRITRGSKIETYVVPLSPSRRISEQVDSYFGNYPEALVGSPQRELLQQWMAEESTSASVTMIVLLAIANTFLAGAIVAGAWKIASAERQKAAPGANPASG